MTPILQIVAAAVLWSTGGVFIKKSSLGAFELCFLRSLLAAATVAFLTRSAGFRLNRVTLVASVLYALLLVTFVSATKLTTAANAIFLQYTAPIYILLFGPVLFHEKLHGRDIAVVAACVGGMALFFVGKLRPQDVSGNLCALASGLCFAFFILLLRHPSAERVNRASSVIYGNLILAAVTAPSFVHACVARGLSVQDASIAVYLGIVQIGFAYVAFTQGILRGVRPLDAGIVGYIEPVLNPIWVLAFTGERPSNSAIVGGCVIIAAVVAHNLAALIRERRV